MADARQGPDQAPDPVTDRDSNDAGDASGKIVADVDDLSLPGNPAAMIDDDAVSFIDRAAEIIEEATPTIPRREALLPTLRYGMSGTVSSEDLTGLSITLRPGGSKPDIPLPAPEIDTARDAVPKPIHEALEDVLENSAIITSALRQTPRRAETDDVIGDRYVVEGQIGRGGMGRVYHVRHQVLGKPFALKLIRAPIAANQTIREMFYREARLASSVSHDNIVTIVDFGQDSTFGLFMVMELLEGSTLWDKVRTDGPMAPKVACDVIWQVSEAVRYIHSRSIIHGDIKSENILLTSSSERHRLVKLLDFGLARMGLDTQSRGVEGTPEYLAPERIQGGSASQASDIYALGIMFWELLVGRLPFTGDIETVFQGHMSEPLPRPSEHMTDALDERADALIARATAKDPAARHPDVAGFLYELHALMDMLGMKSARRRIATKAKIRGSRSASRRNLEAAEVFEFAPIPLAAIDTRGRVRLANTAFAEFIGLEVAEISGVHLSDTGLVAVYPSLLDDVEQASSSHTQLKRVIFLSSDDDHKVEVAVILTPGPRNAGQAGDVHLALHPLGRVRPDKQPDEL